MVAKRGAPPAKSTPDSAKKPASKAASSSKASKSGPAPTYTIYFSKLSAVNLPAKDLGGGSDPYLQFELEGEKEKPRTKHLSNTTNPNWPENIELKGFTVGNDILKVTVFDHDLITADDPLGIGELLLRNVPLGVTSTQEVPLIKYVKGKPEKNKTLGSGGTVKFQINIQPIGKKHGENPWLVPFYNAVVDIVSAKEVPVGDAKRGTTDPLIVVRLSTSNAQKQKTKPRRRTLNPTWNEQKSFLLGDLETDKLKLMLFDDGSKDKDEKLSEGLVNLKEFKPGDDFVEKEVPLTPSDKYPTGGIVLIRVKIDHVNKPKEESASESDSETISSDDEEPKGSSSDSGSKKEAKPSDDKGADKPKAKERAAKIDPEGPCPFEWGSYSSSYTTNFTGYTDKGPGLSYTISDEEEHFHAHKEPEFKKKEEEDTKVKGKEVLSGVVRSAEGLIKAEAHGTDSYVVVALAGKKKGKVKKEEKSKKVEETSEPDYSFPFDLGEVRKGLAVEFTVFQSHRHVDAPIGWARKEVKEIEEDDHTPVEIELQKPLGLKAVPKAFAGSWGKLLVEFDKRLIPEAE